MADAFSSNYNLTLPEVGQSRDSWGGKLNLNFSTLDSTIKSVSNAAAAAQATANAALPLTGGALSGGLTAPGLSVDANGYLVVSGGNLVLNCDSGGDYYYFDRTSNFHAFNVGNVNKFYISSTDAACNVPLTLNAGPSSALHATTKSYVDAANNLRVLKTGDTISGDLTLFRSSSPATGALFLGNSGGRYLYFDGTNYVLGGGSTGLYINGYAAWHGGNFTPGLYAPLSGATFSGTLRSDAQIVSRGGGNVGVTVYDVNQGAAGMMYGGSNGLYFANMDANGNYAGSWRGMFDISNNFTAQGNVTAFSMRAVKDNIAPIRDALATVERLHGRTFTRKDAQDTSARHMGLIVDEVEGIVDEVVHTDHEGKKSLAYGNLVALLIEAVKEMSHRIADLEDEVG